MKNFAVKKTTKVRSAAIVKNATTLPKVHTTPGSELSKNVK
ncbi:MAG: hypothetical protein ACOYMF_15195 [Bacteroidales bacterium]